MIIVQVTVDGYLTYHEKMSFLLNSNGIQRLSEGSLILDLFSILFDPKYDENYSFASMVSPTVVSPYVEIVFDQENRVIWGEDQIIEVKRYLLKPQTIFVNNVSMKPHEFQTTIGTLGFLQFFGTSLQRMDLLTINKFKYISSTSLWNMVNELFRSEDLFRVVETKENIHRNLMLQNHISNDLEELNKQLPFRLQQKDNTKKHFSLSKKLKTLYKIIADREMKILNKKKKTLDIETDKEILNMDKHKQFLKKSYTSRIETIAHNERVKKLKDGIDHLTEEAQSVRQDYTEYFSYIPFEDVYHRYEDLEKSSDEVITEIESLLFPYWQFIEQFFKDDSIKNINRIKRQLLLTIQLPSHENIVLQIFKKSEEIVQEHRDLIAELEKTTKELKANKATNEEHRLDHNVVADEVVGKVHKFHNDSYDLQKRIILAKQELFRVIKEKTAAKLLIVKCETNCNINPRLARTLFEIECFINDPITGSEFKEDYFGPLFNYLQPKNLIERDLWHEIVPLMSVFMFGKVSTARAFHLALSKSGKKYEGYTLMGMDDFYTRPYQAIPHDLKEKVDPASDLVKVNIRFQHILFRLLDGTIRVNDKQLNIEQLFRSKVAIVSNDTSSIGYWNSLVSVGWFTNASVSSEDSPLEHLHTLYRYVGNFIKEEANLRNVKAELESMKAALQELHSYKHRFNYVVLHRTKDCFHLLMEKELKLKEDIIRINEEMKCYEILKDDLMSINSWNLEELTASILRIDLPKIHQKNEMKCEIEEKFAKLHDINLVMSIHNKEMERWMSKTIDHWNQWNCTTMTAHKVYLEHCQQLNNDYFDMLFTNMFQETDDWDYSCVDSSKEHCSKIKLIETKGTLFKLHNDIGFIKEEMLACERVFKDVEANDMVAHIAFKGLTVQCILEAIDQLEKEIKECPEPLSREQYVDLRETIHDVVKFSQMPTNQVVVQNSTIPKALPYINRLIVKMLQDTLAGYELTYKYAMSKFIRKAKLYCYENTSMDPSAITDELFNWQHFDLSRFRSIDFKTSWIENGREIVGDEVHRAIKTFLLVLHLVRYVSHFRFMIIDERFYDIMDSQLADKIKILVEMFSKYIQVFVIIP